MQRPRKRDLLLAKAAVATVLSMSMLAQPVSASDHRVADSGSKAAADALLADYASKSDPPTSAKDEEFSQ